MVGTSQDTMSLLSPRLSDTDSGGEEGGEGKRQDEKSGRGDGGDSGATVDNRDETMGVSLGPVAQGYIVGVSCARARWFVASLAVFYVCDASTFIFRIALAVRVWNLEISEVGESCCRRFLSCSYVRPMKCVLLGAMSHLKHRSRLA